MIEEAVLSESGATEDDATILFVAIGKPTAADGSRTMPLSRIKFGPRSQLEGVQF